MAKYDISHSKSPHHSPFPQNDDPSKQARGTNFALNQAIGRILQVGVIVSSVVICCGLILSFAHSDQVNGQDLLTFPHTLGEVGAGLLALRAQAFIALGLLLLIATPVVRVAVSIVGFAREHDRRYVLIASLVLLILLLSFLLGRGGS